jgi:hypothetical protein
VNTCPLIPQLPFVPQQIPLTAHGIFLSPDIALEAFTQQFWQPLLPIEAALEMKKICNCHTRENAVCFVNLKPATCSKTNEFSG